MTSWDELLFSGHFRYKFKKLISLKKNEGEDAARSTFRSLDNNHNGYLDYEEVNRAFDLMEKLYGNSNKSKRPSSMMNLNAKSPQYD